MAKLSSVRVDQQKATQGIWVDYEQGIRLLIGRSRNPNYDKFLQDKMSASAKSANGKVSYSEEEIEELVLEGMARHVLLGWENVEDEGPYTPERGIELFKNPEFADFYLFVKMISNNTERFRVQAVEVVAKN